MQAVEAGELVAVVVLTDQFAAQHVGADAIEPNSGAVAGLAALEALADAVVSRSVVAAGTT